MSLAAFYDLEKSTPATRWIRNNFEFPYDDRCLIWPWCRKGGGYAEISAQHLSVHRLMCEHKNGPAPSSSHHAAHSCGRGHDGCVNPQHLNWRTPAENQLERYEHQGCLNPRFKLDWDTVEKIRALKGERTADAVGSMFNITDANVRMIWAGKTWAKKYSFRVFTPEEVRLVRSTPWKLKSAKQWAAELGATRSQIDRIRDGSSYRYVESVDAATLIPSADRS